MDRRKFDGLDGYILADIVFKLALIACCLYWVLDSVEQKGTIESWPIDIELIQVPGDISGLDFELEKSDPPSGSGPRNSNRNILRRSK